jgi:hypothetical protein
MKTKPTNSGFFQTSLALGAAFFIIASNASAQEAVRNPGGPPPDVAAIDANATAAGNVEATAERVIARPGQGISSAFA